MIGWVEFIAVTSSLTCVILTIQQKLLGWYIGLIGITAYFFVFMESKLYADMFLQVAFFAQSAYGIWFWSEGQMIENADRPIDRMNYPQKIITGLGVIVSTILISFILKGLGGNSIVMDAFVCSGSLMAMFLMGRKVIES